MLEKYRSKQNIKNMDRLINEYNINNIINNTYIDSIVFTYLKTTMLFISVYGLSKIRDNIIIILV